MFENLRNTSNKDKAESLIPELTDLNDLNEDNSDGKNKIDEFDEMDEILCQERTYPPPSNQLEAKRESGRKRSKKSRDRKKNYLLQLEKKISDLEAENFRLQNLLISYRTDKLDLIGKDSLSFVEQHKAHKNDTLKKFFSLHSQNPPTDLPQYMFTNYTEHINDSMNKHRAFLDKSFESIINHPFPNWKFKYWGDLTSQPLSSLKVLQKYEKLSKYQKEEFMHKNNISKIDTLLSSMKLTKKQYSLMQKFIENDYDLKRRYLKGIRHLLEAKEIFEDTILDHVMSIQVFLKSQILTDQQIFGKGFRDNFVKSENAFQDIWNIKIKEKEYTSNITQNPILGKISKKYFKKEEDEIYMKYNHFYLP